jgi:hypothetical protein
MNAGKAYDDTSAPPAISELQPQLEQLEANPGSVLLLAVEMAESQCNFCRVTWAWLSKQERRTLKSALERARKKRAALRQEARGELAAASEGRNKRSVTTNPTFQLRL